jgi:hypothetical protein
MRQFLFLMLLGCTGKDELDCPDGMVRNASGDCILLSTGGPDTDPGPDTGDTGDTGDTRSYDVCPKDATYAAIQEAIDASSAGDTLTICPETFNESVTLNKPLTLLGNPEGATTRIDARGEGVTLTVTAAADGATLSHLVLRNGSTAASAASGGYGGGLLIEGAQVTAGHIQIEDGTASLGGGGLALLGSDSTLEDITIRQGRSGGHGGGVYVSGGAPTIRRLLVESSYAGHGGGLYATQSALTVSAAIFFKNDAQSYASGILVEDGLGAVFSNVVVALGEGGDEQCAVDTEDGASLLSAAAFNNQGIGLCTAESGYNLSFANTVADFRVGGVDGEGDHDRSADPLFVSPPDGDFKPREGSPCIDAGSPDGAYSDRDGTRSDIGAYGGPDGFQ